MNGTLELTVPAKAALATTPAPPDINQLDTAKPLEEVFQPFTTTLAKWEAKVQSLVVTDIGQKTEMAQARLARLELKEARVTMDKTRLSLVAGLKARTSKIDSTAREIREKIEALEATLLESEQFAERHSAKMKAELKLSREQELAPFMDTPILGDLSDLSAADYATTLENTKLIRQAKLDAAAKAEVERKAKEEAERVERERIAAENARLKAEAIERERLAEIERQKAEVERQRIEAAHAEERRKAKEESDRLAAQAEAERKRLEAERATERRLAEQEAARLAEEARKEREAIEAKARAEAEVAAQEAAKLRAELEAKARAEKKEKERLEAERIAAEKAAKKAAAAPDKAKLVAFAETVRRLELPVLSNPFVATKLTAEIEALAAWVDSAAENL